MLLYDNVTYNGSQIETLGHCQQTVVQYKWGFSFLLLFSLLVSLLAWCIGMYATYLDSYLHSRLDTIGRHLGLQRATLDLASAMDPYVSKEQSDIASNSKVRELVAGSNLSYAHLVSEPTLSSRGEQLKAEWRAFNFKQWVKRDKWWFSFSLLVFLFWIQSWYPLHYLPPFLANTVLLAGLALVLFAGPESKARWLMFVVAATLYAILTGLAISGTRYEILLVNPVFMVQWAWFGANRYSYYYV